MVQIVRRKAEDQTNEKMRKFSAAALPMRLLHYRTRAINSNSETCSALFAFRKVYTESSDRSSSPGSAQLVSDALGAQTGLQTRATSFRSPEFTSHTADYSSRS